MVLESYLRKKLNEKEILLMTHIVLGYPSFHDSLRLIEAMVASGVDLMELQIPFSEPTADGPVIVHANQKALQAGATVKYCLNLAETAARSFDDIPFLLMSYYNIPFRYGVDRFVSAMSHGGLRGAIIPDLPPEEGRAYLDAMHAHNLAPILIFSPTTSLDRMRTIAASGGGFIYCVARAVSFTASPVKESPVKPRIFLKNWKDIYGGAAGTLTFPWRSDLGSRKSPI
jgi:tryptophan synthase alpha chain